MGVELLSVFFLIQAHFCWSQYIMIAPSQPIITSVGGDVTLPCQLDAVKDLRDMVVEWARPDLTPRYIHIRRDGLDFLLDQNSLFLGRTAVSENRLQRGDMSLSLTRVKLSDGGTYHCFIPQINTRAEVTLLVVSVAPPSVSLTKERSGSPVLRCESRGWYPEPELEWLDSEGTVLLRTEAQRGASDELFSVSSRLSVEQRLGNTFTCRVRQQESGQSREAQLTLTDEFLESCASCSLPWILFTLGLVLAAAVALVVWKFKPKTKKSENKDIELGEKDETESMIKSDEKTNILQAQEVTQRFNLKESVPERKENLEKDLLYVNDVINKLIETKEFLGKLREKPQETIHLLTTNIDRETRKLSKLFKANKKDIQKHISELERQKEECDRRIKEIDRQIKATEYIILVSAEKKGVLERELNHMKKSMEKEKEDKDEVNDQDEAQDQSQGAQSENKAEVTDGTVDDFCNVFENMIIK